MSQTTKVDFSSAFKYGDAISRYTNGECLMLAYELAKRTNNKIGVLLIGGSHAFALSDDETTAIDIYGERPIEDMLETWGADNMELLSVFDISCRHSLYRLKRTTDDFIQTLDDPYYDDDDVEELEFWADHVLNNLVGLQNA